MAEKDIDDKENVTKTNSLVAEETDFDIVVDYLVFLAEINSKLAAKAFYDLEPNTTEVVN